MPGEASYGAPFFMPAGAHMNPQGDIDMSDEIAETPNTDAPAGEQGVDYEAKYQEALANSRKWEGLAKKDKDDADNWRKHQDSLRSREEQLDAATKAAEARAVEAETRLARAEVARKHGITDDYFDLLTASDPEALQAQAEKVAALIAQKNNDDDPFPKADPSQGPKGSGSSSNADVFAAFAAKKL